MKKITAIFLTIAIICIFSSYITYASNINHKTLKILHIGLHKGCLNDFEEVAHELSINVTSWYIHSDPAHFDEYAKSNAIYNIGHDRAARIWKKHKQYFDQFDIIMTSDTAPLARIFLQNGWEKPLIIWICNRFDYYDGASLDCKFPDAEYYDLMRNAASQKNVKIISYTPYEHYYAAAQNVHIGTRTIKPIGCLPKNTDPNFKSEIPNTINQQNSLFLYPRLETHQTKFIQQQCHKFGITIYTGRYNSPEDLKNFKGVLYFPYQWSNLALFENIQQGIIHFVPSEQFVQKHRSSIRYVADNNFHLCEWYCDEYRDLFVYFDSWEDLNQKIKTTDYAALSAKIKLRAQQHRATMLSRWQEVFDECKNL